MCPDGRHCWIRVWDKALKAWFLKCVTCSHSITSRRHPVNLEYIFDPQPGDHYTTPSGATVEIVTSKALTAECGAPVRVFAYRFKGFDTVHLSEVHDITDWHRTFSPEELNS